MKNIFSLLFVCCASVVQAQNQPPQLSNISLSADVANTLITVHYDLADAESDDVEITVRLSVDGGETFLSSIFNVQGDAGYPVTPGLNKQVTFNYDGGLLPGAGWKIKITADDLQSVDIGAIANMVDSVRLKDVLTFIQGIRHYQADTAHLEAVKNYIERHFVQSGLQTYRQPFLHVGYNAHNILGRHPGATDESKTYIIDAHFDTVDDSPGADDNGSGVAGVLEAMRILSQFHFKHSIKFIGFDFEESSPVIGLIGSEKYVNEGIKSYEQLEGVFNFEMIGYYSEVPNTQQVPFGFNLLFPTQYNMVANDSFRGNFIVNTANTASEDLKTAFDNAAAAYVPELKVVSVALGSNGIFSPDFRRSDHARFWDAGHKALMLTDGANFRNTHYHTPDDTLGNLNFTFMSRVVKATIAAVATLAQPIHADVAVVDLFATSAAVKKPDCSWNVLQSSAGIFFSVADDCRNQRWHICTYNSGGRKIFEESGDGEVTFDITRFTAGIYFFTATSENQRISKTFAVR